MFIGAEKAGRQSFTGFHDYTPIVVMWSVSDMVLDGIIAGLLWYYLQKSRSGHKGSDNIIDTLIVFTVQTGAITFSASTAHLITFLASPSTAVHFAFHFVLAKLYTNSLYASLNTRAAFRRQGESSRSMHVLTDRTTSTGRPMVDSPGVSKDGTSNPRLYLQRPIEISYVTETQGTLSPPPTARPVEKLELHTNSRGYLQDDYKYESA